MKTLSIIIPAYCEAHRIKKSIESMKLFQLEWTKKWPAIELEMIYSIEKSSDNTLEIAETMLANSTNFKVIGSDIHRGKGFAVKTGILNSIGDVKLFMDLDLSTDLSHIKQFYDLIASNEYDMVIGDRKSQESKIIHQQSIFRRMASFLFNKFVSSIWLKGINDSQCGFKAFSSRTANFLFSGLHSPGYTFDVEILYKAKLLSLKIKSCPVIWNDEKGSKVKLILHSFQILKDLIYLKTMISPLDYIGEFKKNSDTEKEAKKISRAA
jgi:dolichyl-phosphate beta-glucosyltransferase